MSKWQWLCFLFFFLLAGQAGASQSLAEFHFLLQAQAAARSDQFNEINGQLAPSGSRQVFFQNLRNCLIFSARPGPDLQFSAGFMTIAGKDSNSSGFQSIDAFLSYAVAPALQVDAGSFLIPDPTALKAAAALLGSNRNTLIARRPHTNYDRDLGLQLRGTVFGTASGPWLEYRLAAFNGAALGLNQSPSASQLAGLRGSALLTLNLFGLADPGFVKRETWLGKRKVISLTGSIDLQEYAANTALSWRSSLAMVIDLPLAGNGLSLALGWQFLQADYRLDYASAAWLQAGYYFSALKLQPYGRYGYTLWRAGQREDMLTVGLAFFLEGTGANLKLDLDVIRRRGSFATLPHREEQLTLQWQFFI